MIVKHLDSLDELEFRLKVHNQYEIWDCLDDQLRGDARENIEVIEVELWDPEPLDDDADFWEYHLPHCARFTHLIEDGKMPHVGSFHVFVPGYVYVDYSDGNDNFQVFIAPRNPAIPGDKGDDY